MTLRRSSGLRGLVLVLLLFPVAHAAVQACFDWQVERLAGRLLLILGLGLVLGSCKVASSTGQALAGLFAGFCLWAALGEIPHHAGHLLHGNPTSWGLILMLAVYFVVGGRDAEFWIGPSRRGVRVTFEFFTLVWALHVALLTAYYDPRFGPWSWLTWCILGIAAALTPWWWRYLTQIGDLGEGIRFGVIVASVIWTIVEILMKWRLLPKPWKPMQPWVIAACLAALVIGWRWSLMGVRGNGRRRVGR